MTDKEKIRELIEKRYEYWKEKEFNSHSTESEIRMSEGQHLLLMIDSLQEEPVSEDLEEAAKNHAAERFRVTRDRELAEKCKWSFKVGAEWQKEKDYKDGLDNDNFLTFAYMDGMDEGKKGMREQMIKNSIEAKVKSDKDGLFTTETWDEMNGLLQKIDAKEDDKVYISIIK